VAGIVNKLVLHLRVSIAERNLVGNCCVQCAINVVIVFNGCFPLLDTPHEIIPFPSAGTTVDQIAYQVRHRGAGYVK
jgi:hypothetical protein